MHLGPLRPVGTPQLKNTIGGEIDSIWYVIFVLLPPFMIFEWGKGRKGVNFSPFPNQCQ